MSQQEMEGLMYTNKGLWAADLIKMATPSQITATLIAKVWEEASWHRCINRGSQIIRMYLAKSTCHHLQAVVIAANAIRMVGIPAAVAVKRAMTRAKHHPGVFWECFVVTILEMYQDTPVAPSSPAHHPAYFIRPNSIVRYIIRPGLTIIIYVT